MQLKSGWVAIIGVPNVGKSTLFNQILKESLSIVTPKPQTTRDSIQGILTVPEKGQMILMDTPGVFQDPSKKVLHRYMLENVDDALISCDLIWLLVDPLDASVDSELEEVLRKLTRVKQPLLLVLHKSDQWKGKRKAVNMSRFESLLKKYSLKPQIQFEVSSVTGVGIKALLDESWSRLPQGPFYYPDESILSNRPVRFFAAECVRKQIFFQLKKEIPYSCAVKIENYKELKNLTHIETTIFVERPSQRAILIGKNGSRIKEIGIEARKELEKFLEQKVYLGLKVDVLENWTQHPEFLKGMGYPIQSSSEKKS